MSFHVAIQKAPERQGRAAEPTLWASGNCVVTISGTYLGPKSDTMTLTVVDAGTPGTTAVITITWSYAGQSDTGTLNIGTDAGYAAGDVIALSHGLSVAFSAHNLVASEVSYVVVTAGNKIVGTPVVVAGDADPTDVQIPNYSRGDMHVSNRTWDGREMLGKRANTGRVSLFTDYLDDTNRDKLLYLKDSGASVCVAENYDENTLFLFHGGGAAPMIGDFATFTRAGANATYPHPRTGLLKEAAVNVPRIVAGKAGRALVLDATSVNLCQNSGDYTEWSAIATAAVSSDETIFGPFDPSDDYWDSDHIGGVTKVDCQAASDGAHVADEVISAATWYTGSVYIKGFGDVAVHLRTGVGSASNSRASDNINLSPTWQRVTLTGASGGSDNRADLSIVASEKAAFYVWGWQIEAQRSATSLMQTSGSSSTRGAENMTFSQAIPVVEGTLSFWFYWPGPDDTGLTYTLVEATGVTGTERFRLEYKDVDPTTHSYWWSMATAGALAIGDNITAPLGAGWHHIAMTWEEHASTAGALHLKMYIDNSEMAFLYGTEEQAAWSRFFGTGFTIGVAAAGQFPINGIRLEDIRIDTVAWSAAQVTEQYERLTEDEWLHVHRAHAGRKYRITNLSESWLHTSQPDKVVMSLELEEVDREDDSVIISDSD
jgi:hypothetical protein